VTITNVSNSANYQMDIAIIRITTLGSPGYSTPTPTPHEAGSAASGSTFGLPAASPTEPSSYGATITREGAPSLAGYRHEPQFEERIYMAGATSVGIKLISTPASSTDFDVRVTWREIG
jgi:hypothetical protein